MAVEKQNMDPEDADEGMLKWKFTVSELRRAPEDFGSDCVYVVIRELLHANGWSHEQIDRLVNSREYYDSLASDPTKGDGEGADGEFSL